jgi:hypothetical protein
MSARGQTEKALSAFMGSSLAQNLFDLVHAQPFIPFVIHFADGHRFEIKTRDHIGIGPLGRSEIDRLKAVIVWNDDGQWRSVYLPAVTKIE